MSAPSFPGLDTLDEDIKKYETAWSFYESFNSEVGVFAKENWLTFRNKLYSFEDFATGWVDKLKILGKDPVSLYLRNEIENFREVFPLLKYVRGKKFRLILD